jgi:hypothetical protein
MTKLYIDNFLLPDKSVAIVTNRKSITFNIDVLYSLGLDKYTFDPYEEKKPTSVFAAGKYVCALLRAGNGEMGQLFFDLKKDRNKAEYLISKFKLEDRKTLFMQVFDKVNQADETNLNSIELVIGVPPLSTNN